MPDKSNVVVAMDRSTGRLTAESRMARGLVGALDVYGLLSRPVMQRGLYKACRLVGRLAFAGRDAAVSLGPDATIRFPASDPYWNRMLLRSYDHEPELARFLTLLRGVDYGFVDCGANIGYWSVFAAAPSRGGGKPVLAIEASGATFAQLAVNTAAFAGRITILHRAILDRSDIEVRLDDAAHEARAIAADGDGPTGERVLSLAIDDLLAEQGWAGRRLVVKLDVEGVEREALAGMERALRDGALVVYEDHGADDSHALTRHLLADRGFFVHLLLDDRIVPIRDAGQLDAFKRDRTKGYNLIARRYATSWPEAVG
ncbi:FkbM family methyltransferase [Bosea sp. TWI1241]|uniref:FkbM family methyltransferase n=1 Tax=Bosea sp. TWI1241 TaxID=3148904 RepID=UPI00320A89CF